MNCPTCRLDDQVIGVEIMGVYDGVLYWRCERCRVRFHRFPEGHFYRAKAEPFVDVLAERGDATPETQSSRRPSSERGGENG